MTTATPGPRAASLLLLLLGSFVCAHALTACTTPGGQSGQCVSKQGCDPVAKLLRASNQGSHPSGPSYKQLYGSPACDSAGGLYEEKVCCPASDAGKQDGEEFGEESDEVSERRLGRRPRPSRRPQFGSDRDVFGFGGLSDSLFTTRRPLTRDPLLGGLGSQDPFAVIFGSGTTTTRRPSRNPFETEFGGGSDSNTRRPIQDPSGFGNEFTTTRRPNRDPFGSNDDRTTRRPNRDPFGSNDDRTTRRPNRDPFGSNDDRTTRRPNRDPFATNNDRTTRRPAFAADSTTRRPTRPSQGAQAQGGSGASGGLVNPEGCGPINMDRIIGGNSTAVFELPWMARLGYGGRGSRVSYRCGGSLINQRYVLSAAHCMGGGDNPTQIRLGEHDAQSREDCSTLAGERVCAPPVVDVDVEEVIRHPEYSDDASSPNYLQNDIALIRLRSPVSFTDAVKPICLPVGSTSLSSLEGKKVAVAGWGKDKNRGSSGTRFLMKANLPYISFSQCSRVYQQRGVGLEERSQLCAGGERGVDSCQGDSGGPLYRPATVNGVPSVTQLGVVSFGLQNCAVEGVPGVYTRVEHFMPWITRNMRP